MCAARGAMPGVREVIVVASGTPPAERRGRQWTRQSGRPGGDIGGNGSGRWGVFKCEVYRDDCCAMIAPTAGYPHVC